MKNKRYVRKDFYFGRFSSWHCAETTAFLDSLAYIRSGIGRKTLKGALVCKQNTRAIESDGFLRIRYVFPAETSASAINEACSTWNKGHDESTLAFATARCNSAGEICSREINLDLKGWDIEPETETAKEENANG